MFKYLFATVLFMQSLIYGKVYDCFTFFNELELLEIRLEELYEVVDYFVIVEGTKSFTGNDKLLFFAENKNLFKKYENKIIHVIIDDFPQPTGDPEIDNWGREEYSHNYTLKALESCQKDDIILISDVDEIPNRKAINDIQLYFKNKGKKFARRIRENDLICELHMRLFIFQLNRESSQGWKGAVKAAPYWLVKKRMPWDLKILHMYDRKLPKIYNAGWHFTSMGGIERAFYKWKNISTEYMYRDIYSECEENREKLEEKYNYEMNKDTKPMPIDNSFPLHIINNLEYYYSIGWIAEY
ncbi:MAG: hypothetical protein KR126chlam3_01235 [Chlamydiae bacterium]|nr:hypothetical protein [Chlamydiota bacterium]